MIEPEPPHEKIGRPLRAEAPAESVTFRLSPEERHDAEAAATVNHQSLSDFCRDAIVVAAGDCLELERAAEAPGKDLP